MLRVFSSKLNLRSVILFLIESDKNQKDFVSSLGLNAIGKRQGKAKSKANSCGSRSDDLKNEASGLSSVARGTQQSEQVSCVDNKESPSSSDPHQDQDGAQTPRVYYDEQRDVKYTIPSQGSCNHNKMCSSPQCNADSTSVPFCSPRQHKLRSQKQQDRLQGKQQAWTQQCQGKPQQLSALKKKRQLEKSKKQNIGPLQESQPFRVLSRGLANKDIPCVSQAQLPPGPSRQLSPLHNLQHQQENEQVEQIQRPDNQQQEQSIDIPTQETSTVVGPEIEKQKESVEQLQQSDNQQQEENINIPAQETSVAVGPEIEQQKERDEQLQQSDNQQQEESINILAQETSVAIDQSKLSSASTMLVVQDQETTPFDNHLVPVTYQQSAPVQASYQQSAPVQASYQQSVPVQASYQQSAPVQASYQQSVPVKASYQQSVPVPFHRAAPVPASFHQAAPVQTSIQQSAPVPALFHQAAPVPGLFRQAEPVPGLFYQAEPVPGLFYQVAPVPGLFDQAAPVPGLFHLAAPVPGLFYQAEPVPGLFL